MLLLTNGCWDSLVELSLTFLTISCASDVSVFVIFNNLESTGNSDESADPVAATAAVAAAAVAAWGCVHSLSILLGVLVVDGSIIY